MAAVDTKIDNNNTVKGLDGVSWCNGHRRRQSGVVTIIYIFLFTSSYCSSGKALYTIVGNRIRNGETRRNQCYRRRFVTSQRR
jgi:hypothetical protein